MCTQKEQRQNRRLLFVVIKSKAPTTFETPKHNRIKMIELIEKHGTGKILKFFMIPMGKLS